MPVSKLVLTAAVIFAILVRSAIAQTSAGVSATELACPSGTQVLLRLEQANAPAYVIIDEIPAPGGGFDRRIDFRTVSPNEMPTTLDFSPLVGALDVRVSVQGQTLAGFIGCGQWQARISTGQLNAFLLKRNQQPSAAAPAFPAPLASPPAFPAPVAPAPVVQTPVVPGPVAPAPVADGTVVNGKLTYRGFTVDVTAIRSPQDYNATISSIKHQIDIVADCGAKPEIISFFQTRTITVWGDLANVSDRRPILLQDLLRRFHSGFMSGGFQNNDILNFYNRARSGRCYPPNAYLMTNVQEFFAVTASLYLWGSLDREPYSRANMRDCQPTYYGWLGNLFGVSK